MLIWWTEGGPRLSTAALAVLSAAEHERVISHVSAMEIATQVAIGKLSVRQSTVVTIGQAMSLLGAKELPLSIRHALAVADLPAPSRSI